MSDVNISDRSQYVPSAHIVADNGTEILLRKLPSPTGGLFCLVEIYDAGGGAKGYGTEATIALDDLRDAVNRKIEPRFSLDTEVGLMAYDATLGVQRNLKIIAGALIREGILDSDMRELPFASRPLPKGFVDPYKGVRFIVKEPT